MSKMRTMTFIPFESVEQIQENAEYGELRNDQLKVAHYNGDFSSTEGKADELIDTNGVTSLEKGSQSYTKLCAKILEMDIRLWPSIKKSWLSDFSFREDIPKAFPEIAQGKREQGDHSEEKGSDSTDHGPLLSEVQVHYYAEKKRDWEYRSQKDNQGSLTLLSDIAGDVPINTIDREVMGEVKQTILNLPSNRKKKVAYRDCSIDELVEMDITEDDLMKSQTINNHLSRISTFFTWAIDNGHYTAGNNPAIRMKVKITRKANQARAAYTEEELVKLLRSKDYLEDTHDRSWRFWTPILALFTGARQQEIAQLYLDDIREIDGVWVFDINNRQDKRLKTPISERLIPIHPFIHDELNLLKRIERLRSDGHDRLFPEIKPSKHGYGRAVSRWFCGTYRGKCGIVSDDDRMRDFHSFRATFINDLQMKKIDLPRLNQVSGHSRGKDEGTGTYTEDFPPDQILEEVILKVDYHKRLDLTHLKNSKFVPQQGKLT